MISSSIRSGLIKGAGLDVFEGEPNVNPKLLNFKNVFYHLGSAAGKLEKLWYGYYEIGFLTKILDEWYNP